MKNEKWEYGDKKMVGGVKCIVLLWKSQARGPLKCHWSMVETGDTLISVVPIPLDRRSCIDGSHVMDDVAAFCGAHAERRRGKLAVGLLF